MLTTKINLVPFGDLDNQRPIAGTLYIWNKGAIGSGLTAYGYALLTEPSVSEYDYTDEEAIDVIKDGRDVQTVFEYYGDVKHSRQDGAWKLVHLVLEKIYEQEQS